MSIPSPYTWVEPSQWIEVTKKLLREHPLKADDIISVVLESRDDIFMTKIWKDWYIIWKDILPTPQIMWFLLHEIIPLKFNKMYPGMRCKDENVSDKDLVYIQNPLLSVEIKTSSQKSLYWNRSYAQEWSSSKKTKSWYYLWINFEKFKDVDVWTKPKIKMIRFWRLDHIDWVWQSAQTGQQSSLSWNILKNKMITLYEK